MPYTPTVDSFNGLGIGLYSIADAARLLETHRQTISGWLKGYVRQLRYGAKSYPAVIEKQNETTLTFGDLVELMYVREFRKIKIDLQEIRVTAAKFRQEWSTPYPLATRKFATDGRRLLLAHPDGWQHASTGQIQASFDEIASQLVHIGDLSSEWRPLGIERQVVLTPKRAFGKPIDDKSGAHTYVLAQAVAAGDSPRVVAWWYDTTEQAVYDAVEFEKGFCGVNKR